MVGREIGDGVRQPCPVVMGIAAGSERAPRDRIDLAKREFPEQFRRLVDFDPCGEPVRPA